MYNFPIHQTFKVFIFAVARTIWVPLSHSSSKICWKSTHKVYQLIEAMRMIVFWVSPWQPDPTLRFPKEEIWLFDKKEAKQQRMTNLYTVGEMWGFGE